MEYRVLARTYRPATFADLIGQEALVRTLTNAIRSGRIAHAFLLTGIRGVGKTTTARIIARALNCVGPDGQGRPTPEPCGACPHCRMIAEGRHVDVLEMDAASRTGVGDIRDLIDTVQYAPATARTKVYIIDEVHMLSTSAFNALLKTLEEPPPHVKFIFATTESRKIPVTILSRCQRFDLRRVGLEELAKHLAAIAGKEGMTLAPEAAALLAQVAEGSVRDGLSLLDQAIARHEDPAQPVGEALVRDMLGLADKGRTLDLMHMLLQGDAAAAMAQLRSLYDAGADPLLVMQDLLELVHYITRLKLAPSVAADLVYSEHERTRAAGLAPQLSIPVLTRLWQMLLKGAAEVRQAHAPAAAAEMMLVRAAHVAQLPTPAEAIRSLQGEQREPAVRSPAPVSRAATGSGGHGAVSAALAAPVAISLEESAVQASLPVSYEAMVLCLEQAREALLASQLRQFGSPVAYAPGTLELHMKSPMPRDFGARLAQALKRAAGGEWKVSLSDRGGEPTLEEKAQGLRAQHIEEAGRHPLIRRVMECFPGAEVIDVCTE